MGPEGVKACLNAGSNDVGGTLMNETITRSAGASHGQEFSPQQLEGLISAAGRNPKQRTTLYEEVPEARTAASYHAGQLSDVVNTPAQKYERKGQPKKTLIRREVSNQPDTTEMIISA